MTGAEFYPQGASVVVDLDPVAAIALAGLLTELCGEVSGRHAVDRAADLQRVGLDAERCLTGPVALSSEEALGWLRSLMAVRAHLARTLAVVDLPRSDVAAQVAQLAADSPIESAARAFWWTGVLLEGLAAAVS